MNRLVAYIVRFAVILFGYVVASLAASAFLNILFLGALGYAPGHLEPAAVTSLYFSIPFVALFVAYFAFLPAAVVILVSEVLARRDWLFYALAGAVVAAVFIVVARETGDSDFAVTDASVMMAVVGSGIVGGIFYWLSCGRWAGSWRQAGNIERPTSPGRSGS
ncbi:MULTISPECIES: hypothetical protein [unclassified Mesorhizobium]|uniref:hypothetical protein n=1 Tax=unclassified Mesorhizobium TaxID=325217 RepID=UPI00095BB4F6|nr:MULTISPECIES: hypothetical protein [unclassified Mesorhizobium]MBN9257375.1 hypothetical protein [Mesorhizobium sp.]MBN9272046.1 hypothetical protein [Mesorhizobium sp.]OJX80520.1 MAG: hypothetical protein BGO93_00450 [Mesorhizobium sp. 65-26]